ncbi:large conductance mechanosensitive channel protein MscL [Microbacterium sp. No. 7]|uniref:large conductance mechanosensitive channel protein MscL n=1 Tax=Microbacterium sp. No. 7 TaxID=1714373 RepID=UPI0006D10F12|nr:large conductance mechanosensitive channel protein MscL [Microbacterium sp. No. 7]ALJ19689.1 mechanosensitive ion channel protein MscL [Microbacterium sp. No. 7]
MIKGFKDFIMQGNVIDLAVAVVIGAAFSAIVDAIVAGLIEPLIALAFNADDIADATLGPFGIGLIIAAVIKFLAVAIVIYFVFVAPMNAVKARQAAKAGAPADEAPTEQELLVQIRDLLASKQQ